MRSARARTSDRLLKQSVGLGAARQWMRTGYFAISYTQLARGGVMGWVFRKSNVPGGTGGFIQLQLDVGGELRDKYLVGSEWGETSPLTLEQLARARFKIPLGDTVRIIDA
jgi:hypothetical protein